jgi:seryl-tRNA synthetase
MDQKELFKMTADANAKHLRAKLNEAEADTLDHIAGHHEKINELQVEVDMTRNKREVLKLKIEQLKNADDTNWDKSSKEFVESIESLQDKSIFKAKTKEWFNTVQNIITGLKTDIKGKMM